MYSACVFHSFEIIGYISLIEKEGSYELELGPFLRPNVATTLTNLRLYWILLLALPVFFFFFSWASTLGVCPCTFPPLSGNETSTVQFSSSSAAAVISMSRGRP